MTVIQNTHNAKKQSLKTDVIKCIHYLKTVVNFRVFNVNPEIVISLPLLAWHSACINCDLEFYGDIFPR